MLLKGRMQNAGAAFRPEVTMINREPYELIDISQEVLSCNVYPGDPKPELTAVMRIADGEICNLSALKMCVHNGTHVDAPFHFLEDGITIGRIPVESFAGDCFLARHEGEVSGEDAEEIIRKADKAGAGRRILIAGKAVVTESAAKVFAAAGILLIGNESQTVGPEDAPMAVHLILLGAGVVLLEGIVLTGLEEGKYFLNAAPLNLYDADGAPCRAWLMRSGNK